MIVGDLLGGLDATILSSAGLNALTVYLILTGRLVPRSTLNDIREERNNWRSLALRQGEQINRLLAYAETADRILRLLPGHGGDERVERGGGDHG